MTDISQNYMKIYTLLVLLDTAFLIYSIIRRDGKAPAFVIMLMMFLLGLSNAYLSWNGHFMP